MPTVFGFFDLLPQGERVKVATPENNLEAGCWRLACLYACQNARSAVRCSTVVKNRQEVARDFVGADFE
jgi:hypothetical protein